MPLSIEYLKKHYIKKTIFEIENHTIQVNQKPMVTVLLITYQHFDFIDSAIQGILKQKFNQEWEIIIGDDNSTDGTKEICLKYAKMYPDKIRFFQHHDENKRKILNRPCGIFQYAYNFLHARGKYISVCSGDDVWTDPRKLQKQFDFMELHKNVSLSYHSFQEKYINQDGSFYFGIERNNFPKASTTFFINIKNELSKKFIHVIQEDEFLYFILRRKGTFEHLFSVKPAIINTPVTSITRSMSKKERVKQVLNLNEYIFVSYIFSKYSWQALKKLLGTWKQIIFLKNEKVSGRFVLVILINSFINIMLKALNIK